MKFYIDTDFKCHIDNPDGAFREFHDPFFDGKCQTFVEGYRYIPPDEEWTRSDGRIFKGEMITPWMDYALLDAVQRLYEQALIADMQQALKTLGVNVDG